MITRAAQIFGVVYLLVGILGFVPALSWSSDAMGMSLLLGLFPVNAVHNVVHVAVGIAGLAVAGNLGNARIYFRVLAVVYGLLTVLGLIPATSTVFGLVPIGSWDVALHAATAVAAVYFGWMSTPLSRDR